MKPNLFRLTTDYLKGALEEFRHVSWPTQAVITRSIILVIVAIVAGGIILTGFDFLLQTLVNRYLIR